MAKIMVAVFTWGDEQNCKILKPSSFDSELQKSIIERLVDYGELCGVFAGSLVKFVGYIGKPLFNASQYSPVENSEIDDAINKFVFDSEETKLDFIEKFNNALTFIQDYPDRVTDFVNDADIIGEPTDGNPIAEFVAFGFENVVANKIGFVNVESLVNLYNVLAMDSDPESDSQLHLETFYI